MRNQLELNTELFAAPNMKIELAEKVVREKVARRAVTITTENAYSTSLNATRATTLLSPLALAACGGGGGGDNTQIPTSSGSQIARFTNFQPVSNGTTNPNFFTVYSSDLNADGRSDFIVSGGSFPPAIANSFSIVTITSTAQSYEIINTNLPTKFIHPAEILTADFNSDGRMDIFVAATGYDTAPFTGERNGIFFQSVNGTFFDGSSNIPNVVDNTHSAAAGDINGDGFIDIYVGNIFNETSTLPYILINAGNGSFSRMDLPSEIFDYTTGFGGGNSKKYTSSLLQDIDDDGNVELILGMDASSNSMILEFNTSNNTLSVSKLLPLGSFGSDSITLDIKAGDLNNDGKIDLVLSQTTNNPFYEGRALQILIQQDNGEFVDRSSFSNFSTDKPWLQTISLIDVDIDGDLDIVGAANAGGIYIFENDGSGAFSERNSGEAAFSSANASVRGVMSDDLDAVFEIYINQTSLEITQYL